MIMQQFNRMAERGSGLEHLKTVRKTRKRCVCEQKRAGRGGGGLFNPGGSRRVKCPCEGRRIAPAF